MDLRFTRGLNCHLSYGFESLYDVGGDNDTRFHIFISERFRVVSPRDRKDVQDQIIAELERRAETWMLYSSTPKDLNTWMP